MALWRHLDSGSRISLAVFFLFRITLGVCGLLHFHTNFGIFPPLPVKNVTGALNGIMLNLNLLLFVYGIFGGYREWDIFPFSLLACSFLLYLKATDFYILILYHGTLQKVLIRSKRFVYLFIIYYYLVIWFVFGRAHGNLCVICLETGKV